MAWPEGDVFPDGWVNSPFGYQWDIDTAVYASAGSSLGASASGFDAATVSAPPVTLSSPADATFALRLSGASGTFTVSYRPDGGDPTTLLSVALSGLTDWHSRTVSVPAGNGTLSFRIQSGSGASAYAWIDDVVLPGAAAADVLSLSWQVVISPPRVAVQWPVRIAERALVAWPVQVLPPRASAGWPVAVEAGAPVRSIAPWPVRVGMQGAATVGWSLRVIDSAVVGGLDGAGGWVAAPGGLWCVQVKLGGVDISDRVAGPVSVRIADDAARTARFDFLPSVPLQPLSLIGRPVQVWFAQPGGVNAQLMFSGVVETPSIDVASGLVSCECHDQSQEVWANMPRGAIAGIVGGRWHAATGEPADNFEYMKSRLESVGASWSLDALQRPRVTPWQGLAGVIRVRQADVVDGSVSVDLPSRSEIRSRVTCRVQFRYTRLRWRGALVQYSQPLAFYVRPDLEKGIIGKQWLSRAQILSALEGVSGWDLVGTPHIEQPRPQAITPPASVGGLGGVYMITAQSAQELALGFRANFRARWEQSVTEDWSVTLVNPAIESQLGRPAADEIGATLEAKFESPAWIMDPTVLPVIDTIYLGDLVSPWFTEGADEASRDELLRTLMDRAWVRLWSSSRSGQVRFAVPCRPDIDLDVWVDLQAYGVSTSGKVVEVEHDLDPIAGSALTRVTLAVGMPGAAPATHPEWSLPAAPVDSYVPPPGAHSFECGTYVGGEFLAPPFDEETMIGFVTNVEDASLTDVEREALNWYPHQLSIRAPTIAAEDRDPLDLSVTSEIAVAVPTDHLEIS